MGSLLKITHFKITLCTLVWHRTEDTDGAGPAFRCMRVGGVVSLYGAASLLPLCKILGWGLRRSEYHDLNDILCA